MPRKIESERLAVQRYNAGSPISVEALSFVLEEHYRLAILGSNRRTSLYDQEYMIIRCVSALEQAARAMLAIAIDDGLSSEKQINAYRGQYYPDWGVVQEIIDRKYTIGQATAYTLSISSLKSLENLLESVFGSKSCLVENGIILWHGNATLVGKPVISDWVYAKRVLAHMYEYRHAIVHDWGDTAGTQEISTSAIFETCRDVLDAIAWFVLDRRLLKFVGGLSAVPASNENALELLNRNLHGLKQLFGGTDDEYQLALDAMKKDLNSRVCRRQPDEPAFTSDEIKNRNVAIVKYYCSLGGSQFTRVFPGFLKL